MKKHLAWVLTLAMLLACAPVFAITAGAEETTATVGSYTVLLPDGVSLPSGAGSGTTVTAVKADDTVWGDESTTTWYVATGDITIDHTVTVKGNVHLILANGCDLKVTETGENPAIWINATDTNLTIYAQSTGTNMGCLTASNTNAAATAIGEDNNDNPHGDITINGGKIQANSGDGDSGAIECNNITINGGEIRTDNKATAKGIDAKNNLTINGGTVDLSDKMDGIFGYNTVEIAGGTVKTCILSVTKKLTVSGGTVEALAIFSDTPTEEIKITGGSVTVENNEEEPGIYGSTISISEKDPVNPTVVNVNVNATYGILATSAVTISGGTVTASAGSIVNDYAKSPYHPEHDKGAPQAIGAGRLDDGETYGRCVIRGGSVWVNRNDWPFVDGNGNAVYPVLVATKYPNATVGITGLANYGVNDLWSDNQGRLQLWLPSKTYDFTVKGGLALVAETRQMRAYVGTLPTQANELVSDVSYQKYNVLNKSFTTAQKTECCKVSDVDRAWGVDGETTWYVVQGGTVNIDNTTIMVRGHVNLILADNGKLKVTAGTYGAAINQSDSDSSLKIHGQINNSGILEADGGLYCAGIGGGLADGFYLVGEVGNQGAVGDCPAGTLAYQLGFQSFEMPSEFMGWVYVYVGRKQDGRNITINGGTIVSTGGKGGAGIGGAAGRSAIDVTFNGGRVSATGGCGGAGIGGGAGCGRSPLGNVSDPGAAENIVVNGGRVTAKGGSKFEQSVEDHHTLERSEWLGRGPEIGGGAVYEASTVPSGIFKTLFSFIPGIGDFLDVLDLLNELFDDADVENVKEFTGFGPCRGVRVTGGTVDAEFILGSPMSEMVVNGGSVKVLLLSNLNVLNSDGTRLMRVPLWEAEVSPVSIDFSHTGASYYGVNDIYEDDHGRCYLWLPADSYANTVLEEKYGTLKVISMDRYTWTDGSEDFINVRVNGEYVKEGMDVAGCTYSKANRCVTLGGANALGKYTIDGAETQGRVRFDVQCDTTLVLDGLTLKMDGQSGSVFDIAEGKNVTLRLDGNITNVLEAASSGCGIRVAKSASLVVKESVLLRLKGSNGRLKVTGSACAAAIGGVEGSTCGAIEIAGGQILAEGGQYAADIGTGRDGGECDGVLVSGGRLTCRGYLGLGAGKSGEVVPIRITDGTVTADYIGVHPMESSPKTADVQIDGGSYQGEISVGAGSSVTQAVNFASAVIYRRLASYNQPDGKRVVDPKLPDGTVYGTNELYLVNGQLGLWLPIEAEPQPVSLGVTVNDVDIGLGADTGWTYDANTKVISLFEAGTDYVIRDLNPHARDLRIEANVSRNVTLDTMNMHPTANAAFTVVDGQSVSLLLIGENEAVATAAGCAGIQVGAGSQLSIDSDVHGTLVAQGGTGAVSIGGALNDASKIVINGGRITADTIGCPSLTAMKGMFVLTGGSVEATDVNAATNVLVGGSLKVASISGLGGSGHAPAIHSNPVDDSGARVYEVAVACASGPAALASRMNYGGKDLYPATDGKIHLWLPCDVHLFTLNGANECWSVRDLGSSIEVRERYPILPNGKTLVNYAKKALFDNLVKPTLTAVEATVAAEKAVVLRPESVPLKGGGARSQVSDVIGAFPYDDYFTVSVDGTELTVDFAAATQETIQSLFAEVMPQMRLLNPWSMANLIIERGEAGPAPLPPGLYYGYDFSATQAGLQASGVKRVSALRDDVADEKLVLSAAALEPTADNRGFFRFGCWAMPSESEAPSYYAPQVAEVVDAGDNLRGYLVDGTCYVKGTGEMWDFANAAASPFSGMASAITNVVVESGVRTVGTHAFEGNWDILGVSLAETCSVVGQQAFHKCYGIKTVTSTCTWPVTVGDHAFFRCNSLTSMSFAEMPVFGEQAYTLLAGIRFIDGIPEAYPSPSISVSGYRMVTLGCDDLSKADWHEVTTEQERAACHFFKLVLEAE